MPEQWIFSPSGGGVSDHGALTGLADDDHSQYHNDTRGDLRYSQLGHNHDLVYAPLSHTHTESDISDLGSYSVVGHGHTESDITDLGSYLTESSADLLYADIAHTHAVPDHGALSGLSDDDHTQYSLVDGTRPFTGAVGGVDPVADTDLATKLYVDTAVTEVVYYATGGTAVAGTVSSGTYVSTTDHDGTAWVIAEVAATPGFDVQLSFSGVVTFNRVRGIVRYDGSVSHTVLIQVYDYDAASWETYDTLVTSAGYTSFELFIPDAADHVDGSGNALIRFYHSSVGNPSHDLYIDFIELVKAGFGAVLDHGLLSGLSDDDHIQYHNDTRGDARYSQLGHQHVEADITDLGAYVTQTDTDLLYSALGHTHTESDITDLGSYAVTGHTHVEADITDLGSYLDQTAADLLYSALGHTHTESDITDLGSYAVTGHTHTESDITDLGSYLDQTAADLLYSALGHTHVEADITDLGSYSVVGHTHTESDITDLGTYLTEAAADLLYSALGHTHALADLSDTDMTGITDGYVLTYDTDTWVPAAPVTGVTDHGALSGLTDDDHTQYALLAGRSGGQTLYGGTASGDDLYVYSTSNATKGDIVLANGGGRVGIGQVPDAGVLQIYAGNSGGTPFDANYVPISVENSTSAYIQLLTPNTVASGIVFSDPEDWDNGVISYNHGTQTMTLTADAVDTMYLTNGYVGIGASPSASLDIVGTGLRMGTNATDATDKYSYMRSRHYTNAEEDFLAFSGGSSSTQNFAWFGGGSGGYNAATYLSFYAAANNTTLTGTEMMRINSTGVGISTTAPLDTLSISRGGATPETGVSVGVSAALGIYCSGSTLIAARDVANDIEFGMGTSTVAGGAIMGAFTNHLLQLRTNNTARLTIASSGEVGIGTTSPSTRLDIDAGALEIAEMTAPGAGAANTVRIYAEDNGSGKTRLMAIFSSGAAQQIAIQP